MFFSVKSKQIDKLFNGQSSIANQSTESAARQFTPIRNRQVHVRRLAASQNDVAAGLMIHFITDIFECADGLTAGNEREKRSPVAMRIRVPLTSAAAKLAAQYQIWDFRCSIKQGGGHEGAAVVVQSGRGDGYYPVYVTTAEVANDETRVIRVEVDFLIE